MKKLLGLIVIVGFAFVDFLFFHDFFKPGEATNLAQILTGVLSIPVVIVAVQMLSQRRTA